MNNPTTFKDLDGFRPMYAANLNEETDEMRESSFKVMMKAKKLPPAKLPETGKPNSRAKLPNKNGGLKQERVYGPNEKKARY